MLGPIVPTESPLWAAFGSSWDMSIPVSMKAQPNSPQKGIVSFSMSQPPIAAKTASKLIMIAAFAVGTRL